MHRATGGVDHPSPLQCSLHNQCATHHPAREALDSMYVRRSTTYIFILEVKRRGPANFIGCDKKKWVTGSLVSRPLIFAPACYKVCWTCLLSSNQPSFSPSPSKVILFISVGLRFSQRSLPGFTSPPPHHFSVFILLLICCLDGPSAPVVG